MTGPHNSERDKTRPPLPIPPPYDVLQNQGRFRKTVELCGKWPWELVQEDKIPDTWSVNLLDELARAVRIVESTDISLDEFIGQLNRIIEERIPSNKANWSKTLMKTDATAIIMWMTDKKKGAHQQDRTTRSRSQVPSINRNKGSQDPRHGFSTNTPSGRTPGAPTGDTSSAAGRVPDSRGDEDLFQQNRGGISSVTRAATAPPEKRAGRMTALSPMARLLTSVANIDAATPSRKRPRVCDSSPPEETARKAPRSRKSDSVHRAMADVPTLYMVWLSNESAQAKQQVELFKDCHTELGKSQVKRREVRAQEQHIQTEREAAREEVRKLTRDEQQHRLAVDSLRPIVEQENCPAQYREAFESSEKLLKTAPNDKKRAEDRLCEKERQLRAVDRELGLLDGDIQRLTEEIKGHRETAVQREKEQRISDVLLKLVGISVAGITSWDSHRLEALEALVNQVNNDDMEESDEEDEED